MPPQEHTNRPPFDLYDLRTFADSKRDSSDVMKSATSRIKSAVIKIAGSVNDPTWDLMFSSSNAREKLSRTRGISAYGSRLLHFGQQLLQSTVPLAERGGTLDVSGVNPERFGIVIDDTATRIVAARITDRVGYLNRIAAARAGKKESTSEVTTYRMSTTETDAGAERGTEKVIVNLHSQGSELEALLKQSGKIEQGLAAFERGKLITGLVPTIDQAIQALQATSSQKRAAELQKLDLTDLTYYISLTAS